MHDRPPVQLDEVGEDARPLLSALLQLYLHDLSAVEEWDVDAHGSFGEDDLDGCWTDSHRHPFVMRVDGAVAGFAIVDTIGTEGESVSAHDMAEFFVLRKWRRRGVGREAFRRLAALFPGRWEVRPFPGYRPGELFWSQVCRELTSDQVQEATFERNGTPFVMYRFTTE